MARPEKRKWRAEIRKANRLKRGHQNSSHSFHRLVSRTDEGEGYRFSIDGVEHIYKGMVIRGWLLREAFMSHRDRELRQLCLADGTLIRPEDFVWLKGTENKFITIPCAFSETMGIRSIESRPEGTGHYEYDEREDGTPYSKWVRAETDDYAARLIRSANVGDMPQISAQKNSTGGA